VPVSVVTPQIAVERIESWAKDHDGRFVCIRDVASLMAIADDPALKDLHADAAMITPDGTPIALIGKLRGLPVRRTCGPDLIDEVMRRSPESGVRHFLYGGKPGVADKLADVFRARYPGVQIVGTYCPPFGNISAEEEAMICRTIRTSGADVVWVGLSSPKQDIWMWRHYKDLPQTLIGVGAAFDFHTGAVARAPKWMRNNGLEWAHRFAQEPQRLRRRYLVLAPSFVIRAALAELRRIMRRVPVR
ncbi:MAG: WecB/TagA/CpsF family glycosyltransferase, partial [Novosphingobium sp.]|nr:WecB/TagA/CpsF family glycosyltransferase [Novosphingobium sp.]